MSSCTAPYVHPRRVARSWSRAEYLRAGLICLFLYLISPPWVTLFLHLCDAPAGAFYVLTIVYAPITSARLSVPLMDLFYTGYRDLLKPWLAGI